MKVVALISGGKDSCFNMMHCVANDHEIVALANLRPPWSSGKDELDSYLYQTVGHNAIEYYARCMDLPLYQKEITGRSLEQGGNYVITEGDETEDLYILLRDIKEIHPEINAVSVGAILSNYQRVRVEHVCNRLNLTILAYLWRRPQDLLLSEMIQAGIEAILIKVAAIGLNEQHLGMTLQEIEPHLRRMNHKYDLHICGEGGEYETFTLDCLLFKRRINIRKSTTIFHSKDAFAPVVYMQLKECDVVDKATINWEERVKLIKALVRQPQWQEGAGELICRIKDGFKSEIDESSLQNLQPSQLFNNIKLNISNGEYKTSSYGPYCAVSGTTAYSSRTIGQPIRTIDEEVRACLENLQEGLSELDVTWKDVVMMQVFVADMSDFAKVNKIYNTFFGINPPPRALIGTCLAYPVRIQIDCMAIKYNVRKETMHVQSISYWAPANIGPYSQSVTINSHVYIAGQIGLIPATLSMPEPSTNESALFIETCLSLRNLQSVISALDLDLQSHTAICLCFLDESSLKEINHVKNGWENLFRDVKIIPPTLFVIVKELPRRGRIEWQVLMHDCGKIVPESMEECDNRNGEHNSINSEKDIITYEDISPSNNDNIITTTRGLYIKPILSVISNIHLLDRTIVTPLSVVLIQLITSLKTAVSFLKQSTSSLLSLKLFYTDDSMVSAEEWENAIKTTMSIEWPMTKVAITLVPVLGLCGKGDVAGVLQGATV